MKTILAVFLCSIMLLCFTACGKNVNMSTQPTDSTKQTEVDSGESVDTNTQPTEPTTEPTEPPTYQTETPTKPTEAPTDPTEPPTKPMTEPVPTESENKDKTNNQTAAFFNTKNIKRITLYAYYGAGKGSDVPAEHLEEIITWLDSFKLDTDRDVPEILPPGTNTIHVEIEYLDGTITKQGTDTTTIDGVTYYLSSDAAPDCYEKIISKTSFN